MTLAFLKSRSSDLSEPAALSEQQLRRLWLGLPIAAFGLVATLLAATVLLPLLLNLRSELARAQRLERLQDQLKQVNNSLARSQAVLKQANTQTSKLRNLLVGGGDRGTVLATLDNDAKATDVRLTLYEQNVLAVAPGATPAKPGAPGSGAKPIPPAGTAAPAPGTPAAAAALVAAADGVVETPLLLSVQGSFPQILAFLQRLERLQVLVKQQELSLAMVEKPAGGSPSPEAVALPGSSPILVMKLALVVFGAPGDAATGDAATAPGRPTPGRAPGPTAPGPPAPGPLAPPASPAAGSSR
jgi:Tfp pilus assembly protein PilO